MKTSQISYGLQPKTGFTECAEMVAKRRGKTVEELGLNA